MAANTDQSQGIDAIANISGPSDPKSMAIINATVPWMDYALEQALIAQKNVAVTVDHAVEVTKSRIDLFLTTASAHFDQSTYMLQNSLQDFKSEYSKYEDIGVGKIKDSILIATSHPFITTGAVIGVGLLTLKGSSHFLYYKSMRFFLSEEKLLSRADVKVKQLKESIDLLKLEGEKLEKNALRAEDELVRGRNKLKQAGKQIQSTINSANKIERKASGLKDVLKDLPSIDASRFRKQVTNLAKEVKKERNALSTEVTKISNYGMSV